MFKHPVIRLKRLIKRFFSYQSLTQFIFAGFNFSEHPPFGFCPKCYRMRQDNISKKINSLTELPNLYFLWMQFQIQFCV